ncbi:MAG: hypothetical protein HFJ05_03040 [Eubacterium sp.]|nr:hypothetical protein [Eubacterium sp.]MCI8858489.1 hypothetical protein [Lachnospiraceae bacterium]
MLGKLLKHEFRATGKLLGPLNLFLILVAIIGNIVLHFGYKTADPQNALMIISNTAFSGLSIFIIAIYSLTIFTLIILTAVYLTVRFYKTMYGNQGYLTHTLPVSTTTVLNVKLLAAVFWMLVAFAIAILSLFILSCSENPFDSITLSRLRDETLAQTGFHLEVLLLIIAVLIITVCASLVLMVCASLAIGQLFNQFRISAAIGAYVVFYIIQQVISLLSLGSLGIAQINALQQASGQLSVMPDSSFFHWLFCLIIIEEIAYAVIYYLICYFITKKKLNLE